MRKPTKTISGVTPVAVVIKPRKCPHGTCIYCPSLNVPQSYTPKSPAIMRARNLDYNPSEQVLARLGAFKSMSHPTDKIELIILGGTFLSYPVKYQYEFILNCYNALNSDKNIKPLKFETNVKYDVNTINYKNKFLNNKNKTQNLDLKAEQSDKQLNLVSNISLKILKKTLEQAKKINEKAKHRCVALCIETRPDFCSDEDIRRMLEFGCTRVELGVQMPSDLLYKKTKRGHSVQDVIKATERLKNAGFKVFYHIMPGLPGSNLKKDLEMLKKLFNNENFKPDGLKIYPCQVIKGAELEKLYYKGKYKPYSESQIKELLINAMQIIPNYCRIMRIMREIPPEYMVAGTKRIDLRKEIEQEIIKRNLKNKIKEIRFREIGFRLRDKLPNQRIDQNLNLQVTKYNASGGTEYFLEFINKDNILFGLCRLRIVNENKKVYGIIRELHVYGQAVEIGKLIKGKIQHTGLGKQLVKKAEEIAREKGVKKLYVIAGIGVREYFYKQGYKQNNSYVSKDL